MMRRYGWMAGLLLAVVLLAGCSKSLPTSTLESRQGVVLIEQAQPAPQVKFLTEDEMLQAGILPANLPKDPARLQRAFPQDARIQGAMTCDEALQILQGLGLISVPSNVSTYFQCKLYWGSGFPPSYLAFGGVLGYARSYRATLGGAVGISAAALPFGNVDSARTTLILDAGFKFRKIYNGQFAFGNRAQVAYGAVAFLRLPNEATTISIQGMYEFYLGQAGGYFNDHQTLDFQVTKGKNGQIRLIPRSETLISLN